ncbi:hypothetical protein H3Z85_07955 [Chryseobacterium indologenes]|uniref:hypothetical protein n=1 Tax=Chryseobacterium indologenes TaxID=253 RepID=UPI0003E083E7|nr:hypothetical protein [Chryseobacterium indologenes]QPQ53273.1 hypothetical protein H3Z85_07955 [Chryseobacterium indologenes]GAE63567.1 hypothetical protein CIN01S_04_01730 [Chryseobacterium indologenes NBRC 14944]SFJ64629.1 hypothetical protein SAMN05421692_2242 [Chryseobacterium indologenes]SUX52093.1 Uncharacterised protein [Chryseobacterium indologenes]
MRITFDNDLVRGVCEDYELAYEQYGAEKAPILLDRFSDLEAASCIEDIKIGRFVINTVTDKQVVITYYFTHGDDQFMTFEIPQNNKLLIDYHTYKKVSRVKLININL